MSNALKARLSAGKVAINAWSLLPSTFAAEFLVQGGWDSITFDMQHGLHDYASAVQCIQAGQKHPAEAAESDHQKHINRQRLTGDDEQRHDRFSLLGLPHWEPH